MTCDEAERHGRRKMPPPPTPSAPLLERASSHTTTNPKERMSRSQRPCKGGRVAETEGSYRPRFTSEKCQKPQPPLLLKKVSRYTSYLDCNTPPICIAVHPVPYALRKGKYCQYSSHLYRSMPPICIAIRLPFVSQYFLGKSWWLGSPGSQGSSK